MDKVTKVKKEERFDVGNKEFNFFAQEDVVKGKTDEIIVRIYKKDECTGTLGGGFTEEEIKDLIEDLKQLSKWRVYKKLKQELK